MSDSNILTQGQCCTITRAVCVSTSTEWPQKRKVITSGCYAIITEIATKKEKTGYLLKKCDYGRWQELIQHEKWFSLCPPPKTAWEKEEEERGRHNSRFLRVCRQRSGANTAAFRLPDAPISKSPETLVKTRSPARLHKIYRALTLHLSAYSTPKHPQRGTFATCYQPHSYSCSNSEPTWNAPSLKAQIQRPAPAPNVPTELTITVKQHASYSSEVFAFLLLEGKCTARRDKIIKNILYSSPHLEPCSAKLTQFQPPQFLSTNLRLNNKQTSGG